jgi:excisionase family DNA binding protein
MSYTLAPPKIAKQLSVTSERVLGWIRSGRLRAINISEGLVKPRFRVSEDDLQAFLESLVVQPPAKRGRKPRSEKHPPGWVQYY